MQEVLDAALRLLSYRPRSEAELRRRLSRRFSSEVIDKAIAHLKAHHLIDDQAFASYWRRSRESNRPRSRFMVRLELLKMGVSGDLADDALEEYDDETNASQAACKITPRMAQMGYDEFSKRLSGYLRRRGFSYGVVRNTVKRAWQELTDAADGHIEGDAQHKQPEDVAQQEDKTADH